MARLLVDMNPSIEMMQNGPHLPHRWHHGKVLPLSGADHPFQGPHITTQHRAV